MAQGAQLVEVLPAAEYGDEHFPGAVSTPLMTLGPATTNCSVVRRVTVEAVAG